MTVRGNLWFNQYEQEGGDAIDFVRRYYNKDYPGAVAFLLNHGYGQIIHSFSAEEKPKVLEPPKPNSDMRRAYAYLLLNRCIDRDVLNTFIHNKMIYEDEEYHNAVFVGYDPQGKPRHYHKRGTLSASSFKGNVSGSIPEYSFHWHGRSEKIFLFEAPIDMLSFISMHKDNWYDHSYAASCSVSDRVLFQCLNGKKLNHAYDRKRKTQNGYVVVKSYYICENCKGCPHREKCYKGKYENRKVGFSKTVARQKAEATKRITTEEGILLRMNRSIQVEGAFGVIKQDRDFRRFFVRSKDKTETQFFLLAFAFNIKKLWNRTFDNRLGVDLFQKEAA